MGRALKVGDYVQFTDRGVVMMGSGTRDKLFVICEILESGHLSSTRKSYNVDEVLPDGSIQGFGAMYRNEIKLYRPPKGKLPKKRVTFKTWIKERVDA